MVESLKVTEGNSNGKWLQPMQHRVDDDGGIIYRRQNFGSLGMLHIKPGHADLIPMLSMACSDKIAWWNALGIQGGLSSQLINPIYVSSIVVGNLYSQPPIERAISQRTASALADKRLPARYTADQCTVCKTMVKFERLQVAWK
ncbi:hypothetical protein GGF42_007050, partial [Coemansia sp. RSA 2424]